MEFFASLPCLKGGGPLAVEGYGNKNLLNFAFCILNFILTNR